MLEQYCADGQGTDGYSGWIRSCLEHDPISVLRILMTKRNKVTAITAINNNVTDSWKRDMLTKMESQGFKLIEGQINETTEEIESEDN